MGEDQAGLRSRRDDDELVDEASMESFPASDPPAYRSLSIGGPAHEPQEGEKEREKESRRGRPA